MAHAVHRAVAGDAGVVHEDFDRPQIFFDLRDPADAGVVIRYVDLVDWDTGPCVEFFGGFVVAAVDGGHRITFCLELFGYHAANTAGTPRNDCDA